MSTDRFYDAIRAHFATTVPHSGECGMRMETVNAQYAEAVLPYRDAWLGDTERRLIHTGVITTLVDSVCGAALLAHLGRFDTIATLDLRMDYLRPALPDQPLRCRAECYRLTSNIAFLRASVWQDDPQVPVATSQSAFMHSAQRGRGPL